MKLGFMFVLIRIVRIGSFYSLFAVERQYHVQGKRIQ